MTVVRTGIGTRAAAFTTAALIAHQVARKAARDARSLSSFSVRALPPVRAVGAGLALVAALWMSRLLARHSPAVVLPFLFAASLSGLVIEWRSAASRNPPWRSRCSCTSPRSVGGTLRDLGLRRISIVWSRSILCGRVALVASRFVVQAAIE